MADYCPTSIPITITDLRSFSCSREVTSGVTIENRDFSTVPRCRGPRLWRSTSGTVLPRAAETSMSSSPRDEPVYSAYEPLEFCSVTITGTPTTCSENAMRRSPASALHLTRLCNLDHFVNGLDHRIELVDRGSWSDRAELADRKCSQIQAEHVLNLVCRSQIRRTERSGMILTGRGAVIW